MTAVTNSLADRVLANVRLPLTVPSLQLRLVLAVEVEVTW